MDLRGIFGFVWAKRFADGKRACAHAASTISGLARWRVAVLGYESLVLGIRELFIRIRGER
jgi:hypothetical protein